LDDGVPSRRFHTAARRLVERWSRDVGDEVRRLREDAGIGRATLAREAGVDVAFVCRIEDGVERPSTETLIRLGLVLGADYRSHLYPNTGPAIRDRHQARILEALLEALHPRWATFTEIAVRRPSRGWIDAGLHDASAALFIATELQSELRRLEQLIRWSADKAASLPSWDGWDRLGGEPRIDRLLIVRRTRATRAVAAEFERQLRVAYPAHPDDALAALTGTGPWVGPALVWSVIDSRGARLVGGR
jgi:transcriptional regulator with XRE-family HTH domain